MSWGKDGKAKAGKSKKERQLMKIIENSDDDDSEHELSHYLNNRVKLMKQVLKIIKPKKIKSMAPDCMKNLDNGEINSMLLEELLGISNKRLKMIFAGQNVDEDTSSSTDPEEEKKPIDIISLDDVTDDDFIIEIDSSNEDVGHSKKKRKKIKKEPPEKKIKKEKKDEPRKKDGSGKPQEKSDEQNLMSVLELLELQARARAIRSQLALEATRKAQQAAQSSTPVATVTVKELPESDEEDAVIVESPSFDEIVITSSESDDEDSLQKERNEKDKHSEEVPDFLSSSSSSKAKNNTSAQSGESSKQLGVNSENHSSPKTDDEKVSSHTSRHKESPRKHKGMCRKRLEKYKNKKQAANKLEESLVINNNMEHMEDINLVSDDDSNSLSMKKTDNSVNNSKDNDDESQKTENHRSKRLSEDGTQGCPEMKVNVDIKSQSDSEVDTHVTQNPDSSVTPEKLPVQKEPSDIEEKPSFMQEKSCSSVPEEPPPVQEQPSLIQKEDEKDTLLHSQQDGLVINIDDDDIDAINS